MKHVGLGFWIALGGCGSGVPGGVALRAEPQALAVAESYCAAQVSCGCPTPYFASEEECVEVVSMRLVLDRDTESPAERFNPARQEFDAGCYDALIDEIEALGCAAEASADCSPPCRFFTGRVVAGAACNADSECAQGLECYRDRCTDPCRVAGPGQSCVDVQCRADLRCRDGVCDPFGGLGQNCSESPCSAPFWCEQVDPADSATWRCAAPRSDGELCSGHAQCVSGNCPNARCAPKPSAGEVCSGMTPCAPGFACSEVGVCAAAAAQICSTSAPGF